MKNRSYLMFGQMSNKTITHLSNLKSKVVNVGRMRCISRVEGSDNTMLLRPFTQFIVVFIVDRYPLSVYCICTL